MAAPFAKGDVVEIEQRVWSGMNKEGGAARVTKVNADGSLAVAYILTHDKEAAVPLKVRQPLVFFCPVAPLVRPRKLYCCKGSPLYWVVSVNCVCKFCCFEERCICTFTNSTIARTFELPRRAER